MNYVSSHTATSGQAFSIESSNHIDTTGEDIALPHFPERLREIPTVSISSSEKYYMLLHCVQITYESYGDPVDPLIVMGATENSFYIRSNELAHGRTLFLAVDKLDATSMTPLSAELLHRVSVDSLAIFGLESLKRFVN